MLKSLLLIRSVIFYAGFILSLIIHASISLVVGPFLNLKSRFRFFLLWNQFVSFWLRVTCNIKVEVSGMENVPSEAFVLLSNHQSTWETLFFYRQFMPISAILKKELLRLPFFGWALALMKPIAIDRSKRTRAWHMLLAQGKRSLETGISVLIFPEGTRLAPGVIKKYSPGGAALAVETEAKIVPVAHNAGYCWPKGSILKYPGTIRVVIGEPIDARGQNPRELTAKVESWIRSALN